MKVEDEGLLDLRERGAEKDGERQRLDRRIFMQLTVIDVPERQDDLPQVLGQLLKVAGIGAVIYEDVASPLSYGVLTFSTNPAHFIERARPALRSPELPQYSVRHEMGMLGRAYSTGYEPDLEHWMIHRPMQTVLNPEWPWAVWYPLRRGGHFEKLEPKQKGGILREHAEIGKQYGSQGLASDVRLACHGLDQNDNEFVIGLVGEKLHPLSHIVQRMRSTKQTSEYITQMGPFFVGHAVYRVEAGADTK